MKILTQSFGEIEINPEEIIEFRQAIYGFESLSKYVILSDDSIGQAFTWLQSTEDQNVCFVLVDPAVLSQAYQPIIPAAVQRILELQGSEGAILRAIAVIPSAFNDATINLKSPVVINPAMRCAAQVILDEDYPIRAPLVSAKEGKAAC